MNRAAHELNSIIAIAARDVMRFLRTPGEIIVTFVFPIIFMGILGGSIAQNLGAGAMFDLPQFTLFGMLVTTLYQTTMGSLVSLIEDRENSFTQEIFVSPISRFTIILGKIIGGTINGLFSLPGLLAVAWLMQIPLSWTDFGNILLLSPIICIAGGALGMLFIAIVNDARTAQIGTALLVFPQIFLAGILIPMNQSSGILGGLSRVLPLTYVADLVRSVVYAGTDVYDTIVLHSAGVNLAVTAAFSAVFIIVGTLLFSRNERTR